LQLVRVVLIFQLRRATVMKMRQAHEEVLQQVVG
jgi:hypothetical protein